MPTGPDDDRMVDLLERWEATRQAGHPADFDDLCAGCPEMVGELRRRIADLEHIESLMGTDEPEAFPPEIIQSPGDGDPENPAGPVLNPAVVPFGDLRFHARGGLGEVFEGRDESLSRSVAVKLLGRHRAGFAESRRRFDNEAEITSRLEHPGIAPVYCRGRAADGRPYYAMQFIRGETFQDAIDRFHSADRPGRETGERGLAFRQLLVRFQEVCNTIAYAHSRSVLHRDLKPRNIMLGEFGETIVVDWGLGKRLGRESARSGAEPHQNGQASDPIDHEARTPLDEAMGSPGYMSPEQAAGELGRIGSATDVYSLGAILYALLTGRPAFSGPNLAAILERTKAGDFPRPGRLNRLVPPALEAVCLKAMSLRPEDRYASPRDIADELGRWMADEPVSAWREPWTTRARRWVRRHRLLVTSAGMALFSCLVAFGYVLYDSQIRATRSAAQRLAETRGLVETLEVADIGSVPEIVRRLDRDIALVTDRLRAMARADSADPSADRRRVLAAIALLRVDPSCVEPLVDRLSREESTPGELKLIRAALSDRADPRIVARQVWKLLEGGPRARSEFVHFLPRVEADPDKLVERILSASDDDHNRATLVLTLGGCSIDRLPPARRKTVVDALVNLFRSSPDPGLHSALGWLLRNAWERGQELAEIETRLAAKDSKETTSGRLPTRDWYVNGQLQTLAVIRGPVEFQMGSPVGEVGRRPWAEDRLRWRIPRSFAIATHEVTRSQYQRFLDETPSVFRPDRPDVRENFGRYMPEPGCPVVGVTWYEAAHYCNWLSGKEGIPESQWCYPRNFDAEKPFLLVPNYLSRVGYRLPTEAEWEFACRAGTQAARPFGESGARLTSYAWFLANSDQKTHPVGSRKPNDRGLFDMLGNAIEWTFQVYDPMGKDLVRDQKGVVLDREITRPLEDRLDCMLRGGSFYYDVSSLRSANRNWNSPALRENTFGFRVARTLRAPRRELPSSSGVPRAGAAEK